MALPRLRVLFLPESGHEEPWLSHLNAALPNGVELIVFDFHRSLEEQFVDITVVIDQGGHATRKMIDAGAANTVRLWQIMSAGIDHAEVAYTLSKGITLANTPGPFTAVALAEHVMFLMLYWARRLPEAEANLRNGIMYEPLGIELAEKTLAIIGLGASGSALATRASSMGMKIMGIDCKPFDSTALKQIGIDWFSSELRALDHVVSRADYVSLHLPLTAATENLIDAHIFSCMQPSSVLINVARGGLVDEPALIKALQEGRLRAAGLDVLAHEPPTQDHPLLRLPNVLVTPHIAASTVETSQRRAAACAENVARIADGRQPLYTIQKVDD
jgi:phosphoglycerate dehydrogenase-like enzyme